MRTKSDFRLLTARREARGRILPRPLVVALMVASLAGFVSSGSTPAFGAGATLMTVSSSTTSSASNSVSIAKPAGVAAGDLLLAAVDVRASGSVAISAPVGWSLIRRDSNSPGYAALSEALYYRIAGSTEPASYSWSFGSAAAAASAIVSFRGADLTTPIDAHSGAYVPKNKSITAPTVVTTTANDSLIGFYSTSGSRQI